MLTLRQPRGAEFESDTSDAGAQYNRARRCRPRNEGPVVSSRSIECYDQVRYPGSLIMFGEINQQRSTMSNRLVTVATFGDSIRGDGVAEYEGYGGERVVTWKVKWPEAGG